MLRNRREIKKRKEERMGISLMCTSLKEKAPGEQIGAGGDQLCSLGCCC
jgi:hypothetical protein